MENTEFNEYNLDVEYNRNMNESKSTINRPNNYLDLILHKRETNDSNLLIMEFKTYWNSNQDDDEEKIKEFMNLDGAYKYKLGCTVLIGENTQVIKWIDNI